MARTRALCVILSLAMLLTIPSVGFGQQVVVTGDVDSDGTPCMIVHSGQTPTAADRNLLSRRAQEMTEGEDQLQAGATTKGVTIGTAVVIAVVGIMVGVIFIAGSQ